MKKYYYILYTMTPAKGLQKQITEFVDHKEFFKQFSGTYDLSLLRWSFSFWGPSITGGKISFLSSQAGEDVRKKLCTGPVRRVLTFNKKKEENLK